MGDAPRSDEILAQWRGERGGLGWGVRACGCRTKCLRDGNLIHHNFGRETVYYQQ